MTETTLEFAVLERQQQIDDAEAELLRQGLIPGPRRPHERGLDALLRLARRPQHAANLRPDPIKSWDVLRAIEAINAAVGRDEPVLDMGSVGCAILPALHRLGYTALHGIDLNPQVLAMAHSDAVDYRVGDLTRTPWPDGHFAAITSISVIEHGVPDEKLLAEVGRLLRPRGVFLFSTDYWPDKIDTSEIRLFDLDWTIFSAEEIDAFVATARARGLEPSGDHSAAIRAVSGRPINFADRDYTFLSGALVKAPVQAA